MSLFEPGIWTAGACVACVGWGAYGFFHVGWGAYGFFRVQYRYKRHLATRGIKPKKNQVWKSRTCCYSITNSTKNKVWGRPEGPNESIHFSIAQADWNKLIVSETLYLAK